MADEIEIAQMPVITVSEALISDRNNDASEVDEELIFSDEVTLATTKMMFKAKLLWPRTMFCGLKFRLILMLTTFTPMLDLTTDYINGIGMVKIFLR